MIWNAFNLPSNIITALHILNYLIPITPCGKAEAYKARHFAWGHVCPKWSQQFQMSCNKANTLIITKKC